jgi:cysteine desulfurase / selenocysteine lyase
MIYLNNAATSYPKPACVLEAHARVLAAVPQSQFRNAAGGESAFQSCRESIAALLNIPQPSRIFFTSGSTEALNMLLRGIMAEGGRIAATETEHNSVLRPLANLSGNYALLPCDQNGYVNPAGIAGLPMDTTAIVVNHCSNVTGTVQDMPAIAWAAHHRGMLFIADVSQSAGCVPVDAAAWRADAIAFTGHKAMLGPQGTGGFYLREGLAIQPLIFGGTGHDSARLVCDKSNYSYEAGTRNAPGIAALDAGVRYVLDRGVDNIVKEEGLLTRRLRAGLGRIQGVTLYGQTGGGPVVSFTIAGISPADTAYMLYGIYGIILRAGLQCTPLIHKTIGAGTRGVVRASIGPFTTAADIDVLISAVCEIAEGKDCI